jgi:hypothetical protein
MEQLEPKENQSSETKEEARSDALEPEGMLLGQEPPPDETTEPPPEQQPLDDPPCPCPCPCPCDDE